MLDYCAACTAGPRHPNVYTHVQCVDTSVDTDAGGARRGGGGEGYVAPKTVRFVEQSRE